MGTYNILHTTLSCPRCGSLVAATVDCHFGWTGEMLELQVGDHYQWEAPISPEGEGRPDGGSLDGEGYFECPSCGKDSFMRVIVRGDIVTGVEPDTNRPGNIPD